jgi:hypothetical protein
MPIQPDPYPPGPTRAQPNSILTKSKIATAVLKVQRIGQVNITESRGGATN